MIGLFSSYIERPKKTEFYGEDGDETILLVLRRHIITNTQWVLLTILLLVTPILLPIFFSALNANPFESVPANILIITVLFWYLFTFGFAFQKYLLWFFNVHIISNKRLVDMDFFGFLNRNFTDAPLRNVEDVTHTINGAAQIVFNYGDVIIQTAADQQEIIFHKIPKPAKVQDFISDMVAALKINIYDNN